ncbi:DNA primase [Candidatus Nasuia deltocephalinicola]|nr:DNA primase [Candidatus Nasuia deltocephalinicola]
MNKLILCPFHKEKNPSFSFNVFKNCFHCFGCGISGKLSFLKNKFNKNNKYFINNSISDKISILYLKNINFVKNNLYKIIKLNFFIKKIFFFNKVKKSSFFFKLRKIKNKTINKFELGYSGYNTLDYIIKNYPKKFLINTGIFKISSKKKIYNIFYNRIIFPIKNKNGIILGYSGRSFFNEKPKYINSYDNFFFKKKKILYGIYETYNYIIKYNYVILVEGYIDVISLYQCNFKNVLGLMGTSISIYQLNKIIKLTKNIIICFDNDKAGVINLKKSIIFFLNNYIFDLNVKYIILPSKFDPDDFIKVFGRKKFKKKIENSIYIYDLIYLIYIKNLFKIKNNLTILKNFLNNIKNLYIIEKIFFLFLKNNEFNLFHFFYILDFIYLNKFNYKYNYKYDIKNNIYEKFVIIILIFPQIIYFFNKEFLKKFINNYLDFFYLFSEFLNNMNNKLNFLNFFLKIKNYKNYIICKSIFYKFYKKKIKIIFLIKIEFIKFIKNLSKEKNNFYKKNIIELCDILYNIFDLYE